jgi:ethanolamine ammonia-lyase large subunit
MHVQKFLKLSAAERDIPSTVPPGKLSAPAEPNGGNFIGELLPGEDLFAYIRRMKGGFDQTLYRQLIGATNPFKEGDYTVGVGAGDEATRQNARTLLANTTIGELSRHPLHADDLHRLIRRTTDLSVSEQLKDWTVGALKEFLLAESETEIKKVMPGLSSDSIGCIPKLMSNEELVRISGKLFNPLPGTNIGAKGYLGARIQPNSSTDNPDDIVWQLFDAFPMPPVMSSSGPTRLTVRLKTLLWWRTR